MKKIAVSILLLPGIVAVSGVAFAQSEGLPQAGITPESPFFAFERFFEEIGSFFTFGESAKAKRYLQLAEERLAEAEVLAAQGKESAQRATEIYERQIADAAERAQQARDADVLAQVTEATSRHFGVLEGVAEQVPEQAKAAVRRALGASRQGQVSALAALKGEDPPRAVEVGLGAVRAHMERTKKHALVGVGEEAGDAAEDFRAVLQSVADAPGKSAALAAQLSEELTGLVGEFDEIEEQMRGREGDVEESAKEKIKRVKGELVEKQLDSLRGLAQQDAEMAVDIFAKAAEGRLMTAKEKAEEGDSVAAQEALAEYEKYAIFGEEISTLAEGIRTGEATVEELVQRATSHHVDVLEDVRQRLPQEAQEQFQRALDSARKVQDLRPELPETSQQSGEVDRGQPTPPPGASGTETLPPPVPTPSTPIVPPTPAPGGPSQ